MAACKNSYPRPVPAANRRVCSQNWYAKCQHLLLSFRGVSRKSKARVSVEGYTNLANKNFVDTAGNADFLRSPHVPTSNLLINWSRKTSQSSFQTRWLYPQKVVLSTRRLTDSIYPRTDDFIAIDHRNPLRKESLPLLPPSVSSAAHPPPIHAACSWNSSRWWLIQLVAYRSAFSNSFSVM